MKTKLLFNGQPKFQIVYENDEWNVVEKILTKRLGLVKAKTSNLFGMHKEGHFYKETSLELKKYIDNAVAERYPITDDINQPLLDSRNTINIAILRAVPDENGIVEVPLKKMVNIYELDKMIRMLSAVMEVMFSLVIEREIKIRLKESK